MSGCPRKNVLAPPPVPTVFAEEHFIMSRLWCIVLTVYVFVHGLDRFLGDPPLPLPITKHFVSFGGPSDFPGFWFILFLFLS